MKFMFKEGDMVEWDYDSIINQVGSTPMFGIYRIERTYRIGSTIYVQLVDKEEPYYQDRFKLAKNSIVADIIKDL